MAGGMAFCMIAVLGPQPDGGIFPPLCAFRTASSVWLVFCSLRLSEDPFPRPCFAYGPVAFYLSMAWAVRWYRHSVSAVMASVVVTVCFCGLLRDVCQKYSLPAPRHGIPVENDRLISVYVEVEIPRGESVAETIRY
ncbi:uncharacterized protein LOC109721777 [Ananas comosus]|uniref:Uncharacterized protein LOC109721777 n=1 Tax=Ananas comosus TaxID=4615 RepID=A0A6P5G953_ANACO|nr:uncharacterized protein LOC109721777 [Ananas comosus]